MVLFLRFVSFYYVIGFFGEAFMTSYNEYIKSKNYVRSADGIKTLPNISAQNKPRQYYMTLRSDKEKRQRKNSLYDMENSIDFFPREDKSEKSDIKTNLKKMISYFSKFKSISSKEKKEKSELNKNLSKRQEKSNTEKNFNPKFIKSKDYFSDNNDYSLNKSLGNLRSDSIYKNEEFDSNANLNVYKKMELSSCSKKLSDLYCSNKGIVTKRDIFLQNPHTGENNHEKFYIDGEETSHYISLSNEENILNSNYYVQNNSHIFKGFNYEKKQRNNLNFQIPKLNCISDEKFFETEKIEDDISFCKNCMEDRRRNYIYNSKSLNSPIHKSYFNNTQNNSSDINTFSSERAYAHNRDESNDDINDLRLLKKNESLNYGSKNKRRVGRHHSFSGANLINNQRHEIYENVYPVVNPQTNLEKIYKDTTYGSLEEESAYQSVTNNIPTLIQPDASVEKKRGLLAQHYKNVKSSFSLSELKLIDSDSESKPQNSCKTDNPYPYLTALIEKRYKTNENIYLNENDPMDINSNQFNYSINENFTLEKYYEIINLIN